MAGEVLRFTARVRLDWSDPAHRAASAAGCRRCGTATHERDGQGGAVHQSCAEQELGAEIAGRLSAEIVDERALPSRRPERGAQCES